MNVQIKEAAG